MMTNIIVSLLLLLLLFRSASLSLPAMKDRLIGDTLSPPPAEISPCYSVHTLRSEACPIDLTL
jgi:hypothetical protein